MPRGDKTGPEGLGPMTGRAAGYCAGYAVPGVANPVAGRGTGFGMGRGLGLGRGLGFRGGRGRRAMTYGSAEAVVNRPADSVTAQQELSVLNEQLRHLESALADIRERVSGLRVPEDGK